MMTKKRSDLNSPKQNYTHFPHTYLLNEVINSMDYSIELFLASFFLLKSRAKIISEKCVIFSEKYHNIKHQILK